MLELTKEEIQDLLKFIDIGIRTNGLVAAKTGYDLAIKLQQAYDKLVNE